jgi:hypothetical protein
MLADPSRARAMGEAGRRRAETEFSPERSVTIVERVYRDLLTRRDLLAPHGLLARRGQPDSRELFPRRDPPSEGSQRP